MMLIISCNLINLISYHSENKTKSCSTIVEQTKGKIRLNLSLMKNIYKMNKEMKNLQTNLQRSSMKLKLSLI